MRYLQLLLSLTVAPLVLSSCVGERQSSANEESTSLTAPNFLRCPPPVSYITCKKFCACDDTGKLSCSTPRSTEICIKGKPPCKCIEPPKTTTTTAKALVTPAPISKNFEELTAPALAVRCPPALKFASCKKSCVCSAQGKLSCTGPIAIHNCIDSKMCDCAVPRTTTTTAKALITTAPDAKQEAEEPIEESIPSYDFKCPQAFKLIMCYKVCKCGATGKLECVWEDATKNCAVGKLACYCVPRPPTTSSANKAMATAPPLAIGELEL